MAKRTNERTNESAPVFYRTLAPSGPLPCFLSFRFTSMQSRATGIADHVLPLGDLFLIVPGGPIKDPKGSQTLFIHMHVSHHIRLE